MLKPSTPYYLVVKSCGDHSDAIISAALVNPDGSWFYAEVVDFSVQGCSDFVVAEVIPKLRKIPGTRFVKRQNLGPELLRWFAESAHSSLAEAAVLPAVQFRVAGERDVNLLVPALERAIAKYRVQMDWTTRTCRMDPGEILRFYEHCGGEPKVRHNALVDAVGHAICDSARSESLNLAEIRHFELLMGTKSAMSYRAWMRRFEAARVARLERRQDVPAKEPAVVRAAI